MPTMTEVYNFSENLKVSNSNTYKKKLLEMNNAMREPIVYALDRYKMFGVTSRHVEHAIGDREVDWSDVKDLLDRFVDKTYTGNAALDEIAKLFHHANSSAFHSFCCILDKDLKVGIGIPTVNKVWKDSVPTWDVQLCKKCESFDDLPYDRTYASRKLDGVRVTAIRNVNEWTFWSRQGKEFFTLGILKRSLNENFNAVEGVDPEQNIVLDGEICIIREDGVEDFPAVMKEIRRKNHTILHPKFKIFDFISLRVFQERKSASTFEARYAHMCSIATTDHYEVLEQKLLTESDTYMSLMKTSKEKNWEGWILRNGDAYYEGKRTDQMLKLKAFFDHEFTIVGYEEGRGRIKGMLGALIVEGEFEDKHIRVNVGSGFRQKFDMFDKHGKQLTQLEANVIADAREVARDNALTNGLDFEEEKEYKIEYRPDLYGERVQFWDDREKLLGKKVTVQFFEVTVNKDGDYSLRFPVFKAMHGVERTV